MFNAGLILFCMVFQKFPFIHAVPQDKNYRFVVDDDADSFWAKHRQEGINVDAVSKECKQLIFWLLMR